MPQIEDPETGEVIELPYGEEAAPEGPPPELLQMLMGDGGAPPMGPEEPMVEEPVEEAAPTTPADALREVLEALQVYMDVEEDDEDLAAGAKVFAALQTLLAKQAKEKDAALGTSPAQKYLRRQTQGQAA